MPMQFIIDQRWKMYIFITVIEAIVNSIIFTHQKPPVRVDNLRRSINATSIIYGRPIITGIRFLIEVDRIF